MEQPAATAPDVTGYQVDDLTIDLGQQRVTRGASEIPLPHLSFDLLVTLARAAPNFVSFDQLTERVWPGLVITPVTISQRVKLVRDEALGMTHMRRATLPESADADTAWWPQSSPWWVTHRSTRQ